MNIAVKLQNSWELLKSSLRVIRDNPRLALFPIVSTLCLFVLALFFIVPLVLLGMGQTGALAWMQSRGWQGTPGVDHFREAFGWLYYSCGATIYLLSLFLGTFFNVAFYHEILRALGGQPVSLGGGLRFATRRLGSVLLWSLLAGTVGLIIRAIEERLGWIGKIVMAAIGTAWSVAAVFAIPVIIRRTDSNPLAVLRDSALTLKRTWGESLVGFIGIPLVGAALLLAIFASGLATMAAAALLHMAWLGISVGALWLLSVLLFSLLMSMATHVYRCALYVYASEGIVPGPYTAEMMDAGWKVKKA
jgi:hypothetical protein